MFLWHHLGNIHYVPEKALVFCVEFYKFKFIDIVSGRQHPKETVNLII